MKKEKKNTSSEKNKKQEDTHKSGNEKNEKFPGYPLYPESEDIMSPHSHLAKVPFDEVIDEGKGIPKIAESDSIKKVSGKVINLNRKSPPGKPDIPKEDLEIPDSDELRNDGGEDDQLKDRTHSIDMSAGDLDIPGAELDDEDENIGEEDEENNPYSIGGDRHEDLEENTGKD